MFGAMPRQARHTCDEMCGGAPRCAGDFRANRPAAVHIYRRNGDARECDHPVTKVLLDPNDRRSSSAMSVIRALVGQNAQK